LQNIGTKVKIVGSTICQISIPLANVE
jgi:hypothetical protein